MSVEDLFKRLHELDQRLSYMEKRDADAHTQHQHIMQQIESQCRSTTSIVANFEDRLSSDLQRLEEARQEDMAHEAKHRTTLEQRFQSQLQAELERVKILLRGVTGGAVEEGPKLAAAGVGGGTLPTLPSMSEQERYMERYSKDLQSRVDLIAHQVEDACQLLQHQAAKAEGALQAAEGHREKAEMEVLSLVEELCDRLTEELKEERRERVESHRRLERILLQVSESIMNNKSS